MENLRYGRLDATDEEVYAAAKAAHVHHFITTLADGYHTVLNEESSNISQGQKQLLTIARAILSDPAILILDEATSSVDTRTEILIQKAMENLTRGRTSFVIAHRLSTIRDSDMIFVMNQGISSSRAPMTSCWLKADSIMNYTTANLPAPRRKRRMRKTRLLP